MSARLRGASPLLVVVLGLLAATAALLVWVGIGAVRASEDASVRTGLDYEVFLRALDDLTQGVPDTALVRFEEVSERVGRRTLRYDTLVIVADPEAFPSFDQAGFLYDQVQLYNGFQRERAALGRTEPEWFERLRAFNPSVFQPYRSPTGALALGRVPSAWSLRVRSPLEGEWKGEVRTRDVHRGQGFVGPRLAAPLGKPVRLGGPGAGRGRACELVPASDEVQAYCLSEERIPQATFRLGREARGEARGEGWAEAGWADLWLDGTRLRPGDSAPMPEGSVLRLDPLEPVAFARYWDGVVSSKQWVNGRLQRRGELPPPLDLFSGLGAASPAGGGRVPDDASVELTVDAELSATLTALLQEFLESEVDLPLDFGMMVLASLPDGEIVALAEAGERRNRGRSPLLERVAPGSAVKPLLAAAILSQRPDLGGLRIRARSGAITSVMGMPQVTGRRAFSTTLNCPPPSGGWVDLRYFLSCSNNEYAASLLVAGLAGEDGRIPGLDGTRVPRATLLRSPLSEGITALYELPADPAIADAMGRSRRVWDGLTFSDGTRVEVPYELLPAESRPALLAPGSDGGTDLGLLYRYAYGAWENQWTLLDLTGGFARIVTDRKVRLGFARSSVGRGGWPPAGGPTISASSGPGGRSANGGEGLGLGEQPWYTELLGGLQDAARSGTAGGLRERWRRAGLPSMVLAKTGTLNESGEPGPGDDLFSKSLLFAVGDSSDAPGRPLACGVVGGLHLRFTEGPRGGSLPSIQLEFAMERLGTFLAEHWPELSGCGEEQSRVP